MPQAKSMVLLLASLSSAGAIVLHHHHAPGRVVELGTRAGHAAMQHSKGWDDFGKPPFNFYKVSLSAWLTGCLLGRSRLSRTYLVLGLTVGLGLGTRVSAELSVQTRVRALGAGPGRVLRPSPTR